jgi:large subunit ribosomal protein L13
MQTINAENRTLGRVASEAANIILGKKTPAFAKNAVAGEAVKVINAAKVRVSGSKATTLAYRHYTGYPGGLREEKYKDLVVRRGYGEAIRRAVEGMSPRNRLRNSRMKLLTIEE